MKYHMNKKEREISDPKELIEIIKKGKHVTISTCRNNEPYIVTLSYGYDEQQNTLYFHSAAKGLKIDFIKENPKVCATIIEDRGYREGACEHHYSSVVFWGNMFVLKELEEKKHGMEVLLHHLEVSPQPIKDRALKNDEVYSNISMLKLEILELTGKKGS